VSQYVRSIVVKRQFQGDSITVTFRPVKFVDALKFKNIDTNSMKDEDVSAIFEKFKGYVEHLTGLRADDGSEVTVDEFFSQHYFFELLLDVLTEWISRGTPRNPSSPGALQAASQPG
jgi:hypothetical protein